MEENEEDRMEKTSPATEAEMTETAIMFMRGDTDMKISSSDRTFQTRMKNLGWAGQGNILGYIDYIIPVKALTIRKAGAIKKKRNISEATRLERANRMKEMWAKRREKDAQ